MQDHATPTAGTHNFQILRTTRFVLTAILFSIFIATAAWSAEYQSLAPREFKTMLKNKDFFLIDVHIPEHRPHIPGTDVFIDYRKIHKNADKLPADKDTKIVVYCLGGPMGDVAARTLIDMGYTRVYNLQGGSWAFDALPE